jgi:DUF1009 family protein
VIVAADDESETAALVRRVDCGVVVAPSRPELLTKVIRDMYEGRLDLAAMGKRARAYALAEATRGIAHERYRAVLAEVVGEKR